MEKRSMNYMHIVRTYLGWRTRKNNGCDYTNLEVEAAIQGLISEVEQLRKLKKFLSKELVASVVQPIKLLP